MNATAQQMSKPVCTYTPTKQVNGSLWDLTLNASLLHSFTSIVLHLPDVVLSGVLQSPVT